MKDTHNQFIFFYYKIQVIQSS